MKDEQQLKDYLKQIAPVDAELKRDLWPEMLRRMDEHPVRIGWLDWALVGLLAMLLLSVPEAIPIFLYQF